MTEIGCNEVKDCAVMVLAWWLCSVWYGKENKYRLSNFLQPVAVTRRHYSTGIQIYECELLQFRKLTYYNNRLWYSTTQCTAAI